jgi:DNA-binding transcriptional ArsR family regulator
MTKHGRKERAAGMHGRAEEISEILKLLGNPQRLQIACLLCEGEYAVSEIEEKLGIHQPTLSQQLGRAA